MMDLSQPTAPAANSPRWRAFLTPGPRRSLQLCALGAIVGLAIAGLGLFTAKGTRMSAVPAEDVAVVNGVPILMSDYIAQISALLAKPLSQATAEERQKVLDDMIREELYVQRGSELGMQNDTTEVRAALVGATEAQVSADAAMVQPDENDLHAFFLANQPRYSSEGIMTVDDYIVPAGVALAQAQAQAAAADMRKGGATAALLAARGLRRSGLMADGEEFYFAARIHLGPALFEAARRLRDGGVSDPVVSNGATHIVVMRHNVPPVPEHFADIRDRVLADYQGDKSKQLIAANDRFLRKRADILIANGYK